MPPHSRRLRERFFPVPLEREVDEELAGHLELRVRHLVARGMDEAAARAAASRRFGDMDRIRGECREIRNQLENDKHRVEIWQELRQNLTFAARVFRKNPLFTAIAVLTIGIGVGADTAIFGVVNAVLLRPLPYRNAESTVVLWNSYDPSEASHTFIAPAEFADMQTQLRSTLGVAALSSKSVNLVGDAGPERLSAYIVSPNLFDVLGASPFIGRAFQPEDGRAGAAHVVLLSHALWQRRFGADRAILGRDLRIDGQLFSVIGVMPPTVRFPDAPLDAFRERAELWVPHSWEQNASESRGDQYLAVVARLRPGVTLDAARADLDALVGRFRSEFPDRYTQASHWHMYAGTLHDQFVGNVRPALLVFAAAAALLLLIACVNVANLFIARGAARQRELAVRLAIGADRARIVRQLLTESLLLGLIGGVFGIALGWLGLHALVQLDPGNVPRLDGVRMDGATLAFSLGVSLLTGLLFGMLPALQESRTDLRSALGEGMRGSSDGPRQRRLRSALVVAEVAMALVVLVEAGLLLRSFVALERVRPGFDATAVMTAQLALPQNKYTTRAQRARFFTELQTRLTALGSGSRASVVYPLPMSGDGWGGTFHVEGLAEAPGQDMPHAEYAVSAPGYFRAMRIPLVEGRDFTDDDVIGRPGVAIVDEVLAHRYWPKASALGKRINVGSAVDTMWSTVVGVVGHVHNSGPQSEGESQLYLSFAQHAQSMAYVIVAGATPSVAPALRREVRAMDPDLPIAQLQPMEEVVSHAVARQRFSAILLAVFALAALTLATIGLYGVMSYLVTQRLREIGIRVALGCPPHVVRRRVVAEGMTIAGGGLAIGVMIAFLLSRLMSQLLFSVTPNDPLTYFGTAALLLLVALLAAYVPAGRATRVDPAVVLRA
jgi:putative ABC transport system permease protein